MFEPSNKAEEVVLAFFQALGSGDLERTRGYMHPEMTWTVMATGIPGEGRHQGPDAIFQMISPIQALFAPGSPRITLRSMVSNGEMVIMETHGGGQLADGREYDNQYVMALEVKDDKVVALREYMDSYYVNQLKLLTPA